MKIRGPSQEALEGALAANVPIAECGCGNQKVKRIDGEAFCANCGGRVSNPASEPEAS